MIGFRGVVIARVNDHILFAGLKKLMHIGFKDLILQQVVNHVQRQREIGLKQAGMIAEAEGIIYIKALGLIAGKLPHAMPDDGGRHIQPQVLRILRQRELVAVAAAELYHRMEMMLFYKAIQELRLEIGQVAVGATARIASFAVALFPVPGGAGEPG